MKLLTALLAGLLAAAAVSGDEASWQRFRGPNGSGIAEGQRPPVELGPDKNLKWKVPAPPGVSSLIIAGDLLVLTAFENGKLYTVAYTRADGRESWRIEAPATQIEKYLQGEGSPAASTCATDGKRVVSYFGSCGLFCYDLAGKELWRFPMPVVATAGDFGSGVSPIIEDGLVVLVRDEVQNARILALDAATGSRKWETKRQSPTSYSTPVAWDTPVGRQIAVAGHARLAGYDLKTGEEKWSVTGIPSACASSPVVAGGTLYFAGWSAGADDPSFKMPTFDELLKQADAVADGYLSKSQAEKTFLKAVFDSWDVNKDGKLTRDEWEAVLKFVTEGKSGAFALKPGGSGDVTATHVLWRKTKNLPYIASALAYRGQVVTVKDGGIVTAYDAATGEEVYTGRVGATGSYYASLVAADGHIYLASLQDGTVTVIRAGSKQLEVVAKNAKLSERLSATPAIADDTLYVRTEKHLWAFAHKK